MTQVLPTPDGSSDRAPYRIVIAEDDRRIAEIQQRFIEKIPGFQVEGIALTLGEARDLTEILQPDLILLDIHFPEGTGLELLQELRGRNQATDVILVTAAKEAAILQAALRGGVFDYILKPLVFDRLQAALQNYSHHRQKLETLVQSDCSLAQQDVDQLMPRSDVAPVLKATTSDAVASPTSGFSQKSLPKGIDALTLDKVRAAFDSDVADLVNAETLGRMVGVSRTTARRYLEYLVSNQQLEADISYGSVGRPERRYRRIGH
ncbi:response regulator [Oceanospirillum linum]|uniref:Transcriptional regulatory protein n=1 Tax=Oceanospirillum linum TaxID=966 RepID=A0A1T1HA95_OCELI|nr:response regulator [Oceanospirillum linum]OOV86696.1 two-component system response regulator [Oceanospirillum linum]SEG25953.1 Response regulator of citrate/malate metabolism [Oleiphilus messinensis]SMP27900.1 two-component system, CitB family, response regulator [Oceanospirillum linum]